MRILHIGEYVKGGVATYIREVIEFQRTSNDISEVYLLMSEYNSEKDIKIKEQNLFYYKYKRSPLYFINAILQINQVINRIKPDIIHLHSTFAGFFVRVLYFLKKKDVKIVYCPHGWAFLMKTSNLKKRIYTIVERLLSRKTDLIINISYNEYNESIKAGIPVNKSVMIYNGINNKRQETVPVNVNLDTTKINLLFVGRYDKSKGLDILINIFQNRQIPNVNLYIIGSKVLNDIKLDIPENVVEIGWISNRIINSYYQLFDAVIMPSRWEGFGLVALEAMRNKKAVIASNQGALPEIVKNGVNGYIFDIDDIDQLVNILVHLKKDTLIKMGEEGYKIFISKFTSDRMNKAILNCYKQLN